jgi:hypothetical protein
MSLFRPNIETKGRVIRGSGAVILGIGAALAWPHWRIAAVALAVATAVLAFEAARGWCAARACGVKTKF